MKRIISLILCVAILLTQSGMSFAEGNNGLSEITQFGNFEDPNLLQYIEDTAYLALVDRLAEEGYVVEDLSTVYISQEYLEEVAFNTKSNVYFGYTIAELDSAFEGKRYIFTYGNEGNTVVREFEAFPDNTDALILKNIAVGTGVILVCVTVSAVTAGAGAPACSMIFAVAAKTATTCALSGAAIGGISAGIVTGIQTGDMYEALNAGAIAASEGFKWGAISGAISGAATETRALYKATKLGRTVKNGLSMNQVALIQKESGYPLSVIEQFHTYDEYLAFKDAGLKTQMVNGKLALVRTDINPKLVDEYGRTNLQRMQKGLSPIDSTGKPFELHHIGQKKDATLAILSSKEHDASVLHGFVDSSEINRPEFDKIRKEFWKTMAKMFS